MSQEEVIPDAIAASTNLTGSITDIDEDPDSPDGNWLTATTVADTMCSVGFPTPSGTLTSGAGLQEFNVHLRTTSASGTKYPTYDIALYESGSLVRTIWSGLTVAGTITIRCPWNVTELATSDGSNVECRVIGYRSSGPGSKRRTIEIGAIRWDAEVDASAIEPTDIESTATFGTQVFPRGR